MPKSSAFATNGICEKTGFNWEKKHPEFVQALAVARSTFIKKLVVDVAAGVNVAGLKDWRASMALLERIDRENFGKEQKQQAANVTVTGPTINNIIAISPEQLADIQARRKAASQEVANGRN